MKVPGTVIDCRTLRREGSVGHGSASSLQAFTNTSTAKGW